MATGSIMRCLAGVLALAAAGGAQAALLSTTYTDTNGVQVSSPPTATFMNPVGPMRFAISGGLDRIVSVEIQNADGKILDSAESGLIGAEDTLEANGSSSYGAWLSLDAPDEGSYTTVAKILDNSGEVVQQDRYSWTLDRSPRVIDGVPEHIQRQRYGAVTGGQWNIANKDYALNMRALITGDGAKPVSAVLKATSKDDDSVGYFSDFQVSESEVYASLATDETLWPDPESTYELELSVTDAAGNIDTITWETRFDRRAAEYEVVGVTYEGSEVEHPWAHIDALKEFGAYTWGMRTDVYNPRILVRILKSDLYPYSDYGLYGAGYCSIGNGRFCLSRTILHEEGDYAYIASSNRTLDSTEPKTYDAKGSDGAGNYTYLDMNLGAVEGTPTRPRMNLGGAQVRFTDGEYGSWRARRNASQVRTYDWISGSLRSPQSTDVQITLSGNTTIVPAGETDYEMTLATPLNGGTRSVRACTYPDAHVCASNHLIIYYDGFIPELIEWSRSTNGTGSYDVVIKENQKLTATLSVIDSNGETHTIQPSENEIEGTFNKLNFPLESLSTGEYEFVVEASDNYGNEATFKLETSNYDGNPPRITLRANGDTLGAVPIQALGDIEVLLSDDTTFGKPLSIALTGGPTNQVVNLAWVETGEQIFNLEYPIMFPSLSEGDYTLTVDASDEQNNVATVSASFTYKPREVGLSEETGAVRIPAVKHAFHRSNGARLIETEAFVLADGTALQGVYNVYATLREDAELPLVINGVLVGPGETRSVVGAHDFSSSGGRLSIDVAAAGEQAGKAEVLVTTSAPGAALVSTTIEVWKATTALSSSSWKVKQGIEPLEITAAPNGATACRYTHEAEVAKQANALEDPICHFEWDTVPDDVTVNGLSIAGHAGAAGEQAIEYSVWIYDRDGNPYLVDHGMRALMVESPFGGIAFGLADPVSQMYRAVEEHQFELAQKSGPECAVTLDAAQAERNGGTSTLSCLVEWTSLPAGLSRPYWQNRPEVVGTLENAGINTLSWKVSMFNGSGDKILLNEQSHEIEAVAPPAPTITIDDDSRFAPGMYAAPLDGGYIGDALVTSFNAALEIELARDGRVFEALTMPRGWGEQNVVQRRVRADERELWSQTAYTVDARYADLPESAFELPFTVVAVPSSQIAPEISVEGDTALNTESLSVGVRIVDPYKKVGYDPDTMGLWQVRLVKMSGLETVPLTDYEDVPLSGEKSFNVDLSSIGEPRLRLSAEARLVSEVDGYERTVVSRRPVYMNILRGQAIKGEIETHRVSGEAPLVSILSIDLANRLDQSALGAVEWQISGDKKTWQAVEGDARYMTRLVHTFERGTYWVRATLTNANSGAQLRTPTVEITAYKVPEIEIDGPENAFIGSTGRYEAVAQAPDGDLVYEWSIDRGDTWMPGQSTFELTRNAVERVPVWVRARYDGAPADDVDAWTTQRSRLSFREPVGPRVRIAGPRYVEIDKPSEYEVVIREPYRNMDIELRGRWTLPGGGQSEGPELTYMATREDLLNERVDLIYDAWIVGYEDQGATDQDDHALQIWQYQWPEFRIHTRTSADFAPATIVARLRSMTSTRIRELEEPEIVWELPEGLRVTNAGIDVQRELSVAEPGEYTLRAVIRDARGHSAMVEKTLVFQKAPPYVFEVTYSGSNKYNRAPMDIRVRPNVSGGHPRDRIERYTYALDGVELPADSRYGQMRLIEPGTHTVGVTIETQMGNTASGEIEIGLNENVAPTCGIDSRKARGYWKLYARCDDPDGRMASFEWLMNDQPVGVSGSRLTVRDNGEGVPSIQMIGTDEGGADSRPVYWNGG